ncbi:hypothetical protein M406DRAFT_69063 [Cryphonectria parasitica EP155]|uniref:ASTRA-associated protein 1 n=1 Tax=Cryphonectria parasitica (strain ATCC 38755 / EP155) TaxID=660469 RepID=A0A9P4Y5I7_CRYP1|nr:uncharacterized protein M406DRAFT_69063 [Cryphonectria parasitica EP155]KAF3766885.1 hypothetical protein M406DRAFT_69063 [Cryphonectria parasitica EP155]
MASRDGRGDIPPQPKAILRGHRAQVHAAAFIRSNERLFTGDADGFVVAWDLTIMRPRAVWQAHENAILGIAGWGIDKVITHGRDNKLIVWRLSAEDEASMSTTLPLDTGPEPRTKPWMLYLLEVNTMNFCTFACSPSSPTSLTPASDPESSDQAELLIAVPNTLISEAVDIYSLPSQIRIHTVKIGGDHGMVMALALTWVSNRLTLVIGYEDGMAIVAELKEDGGHDSWDVVYRSQCHKQPILSLDVAPSLEYFLTSSADATIAKHPLLTPQPKIIGLIQDGNIEASPEDNRKLITTPHSGTNAKAPGQSQPISLLSAALASQPPVQTPRAAAKPEVQTQPLQVVDTKHSGQQGLSIRSDGRIFATAGWDSKVRVYSAKTMREVAVLKWHPVGCFAAAFAEVTTNDPSDNKVAESRSHDENLSEKSLVPKVLEKSVKDRRVNQARTAHWLAAGSKDGKVSLWDVF